MVLIWPMKNLVGMTLHGELNSIGYTMADSSGSTGKYLVYLSSGGSVNINMSATPGLLSVKWFNPSYSSTTIGNQVSLALVDHFQLPSWATHSLRIPVKSSTESSHAVQWWREATLVREL